jgi:hypothetical protein
MRIAKTFVSILIASAVTTLMLGGAALAGCRVPEIDPGMATGGLSILGVGIVLLLERYRRN